MEHRLLVILVASVVLGAPADARACSIVLETRTLPALAPAPLDAHVWIRHSEWRRSGNRAAKRGSPEFDVDFVVRAAAPTAADIPVVTREWSPGQLVELVPQKPLPANHTFEVWAIPRPAVESPRLVTFFRTGDAIASTAPARPSFTSATRTKPAPGVVVIDCGPDAEIVLGGLAAPSQGELLYAVWPSTGGRIAWDSPPIAVTGSPAPGHPVRFDVYDSLRPGPEFVAWAASSPHIGVRAMDVAGNLSDPVELDVR